MEKFLITAFFALLSTAALSQTVTNPSVAQQGQGTAGNCVKYVGGRTIGDAGAPCGALPSATSSQVYIGTGTAGLAGVASTTGTGSVVLSSSPSLTTPNLGTPSAINLTNATALPTTAISGYLQAGNFPALTGDVTTTAGSLATTVGAIGGKTVSLAGAFSTTGAYSLSLALSGATSLSLPTSGTVATTANIASALPSATTNQLYVGTGSAGAAAVSSVLPSGVTTSSLTSVGTITSGTWSGSFGAVSGANLTNLTAANISSGTASINITGTAPAGTLTGTTLASGVTASSLTSVGTLGGLTVSGVANVGNPAGAAVFNINGAAGNYRELVWEANGVARWTLYADTTAESGSNTGSNFVWIANNDTGGLAGTVLQVNRASQIVSFTQIPTSPTPLTTDNSTNVATTAYVVAKIAAATSGVSQFNGRTGAVTPQVGDYSSFYGQLSSANTWSAANTHTAGLAITGIGSNNLGLYVAPSATITNSSQVIVEATTTETVTPGATSFYTPYYFQETFASGGNGYRNTLVSELDVSGAAAGAQLAAFEAIGKIVSGTGSIFGANTVAWVKSGSASTVEAVGLETNTQVENTYVTRKVGLQIIDVATSTGYGATYDFGMLVANQSGGRGYGTAIQIGTGTGATGIAPSGAGIAINSGTQTILAGIDLHNITGIVSEYQIVMAANNGGIGFGTSGGGGSILSATTTNGPALVLGSYIFALQFSSIIFTVDSLGNTNASGTINTSIGYYANSTAGVTCSGTPTSSFATKTGIVTHC